MQYYIAKNHTVQLLRILMGMGPITMKYHVPWSGVFWRHETSDDVIIFFAERPGQTLTFHSKMVYRFVPKIMHQNIVFHTERWLLGRGHPRNFQLHFPTLIACRWVGRRLTEGPCVRLLHKTGLDQIFSCMLPGLPGFMITGTHILLKWG